MAIGKFTSKLQGGQFCVVARGHFSVDVSKAVIVTDIQTLQIYLGEELVVSFDYKLQIFT